MALIIISFLGGVLTVLAPCILPVLPIIIGGSAQDAHSKLKPYIVIGSLSVSIIVFTLALKATTVFIDIPPQFWKYTSGGILVFFGIVTLFPSLWERIGAVGRLNRSSQKLVTSGFQKKSFWGDVVIGAALGPVFSTCSPTYAVILATVLPQSFFVGLFYLFVYVLGLAVILLLIARIGQKLVSRLAGASDPHGWFKRTLGALFLLVGLAIITGYDKKIETAILDGGFFDVTVIESTLLEATKEKEDNVAEEMTQIYPKYKEIVSPGGFLNTNDEPFTIGEYVGEKVIIIDFMTYSCINCIRTFPYLNALYDKYKDDGLIILGIHTPEFAFEKNIENVRDALSKYDIEFPVVLDNDFGTWRAYQNSYWPRKYIIDIHGNIVYDHIGEGGYEETEEKVKELLSERAEVLGIKNEEEQDSLSLDLDSPNQGISREVYFGAWRNKVFGNGEYGKRYTETFTIPTTLEQGRFYLGGEWKVEQEYIEAISNDAVLVYPYTAEKVFFVGETNDGSVKKLTVGSGGGVVGADVDGVSVSVSTSQLYEIIANTRVENHTLTLEPEVGVRLYTFTFE